jgi:hypothetical protein
MGPWHPMERGDAESGEVILFPPAAARELAAVVRYYDEHYPVSGSRKSSSVPSR